MELVPVSWAVDGDLDAVRVDLCRQLGGPDLFAVRRGSRCMAVNGEWGWEPPPAKRTDMYLKLCRFNSFDEAVAAIERYMPSSPQSMPTDGLPQIGKVLITKELGDGSVTRLAIVDLGNVSATVGEIRAWYCEAYDISPKGVRVGGLPPEVMYEGGRR